jgi:hypothetical protein
MPSANFTTLDELWQLVVAVEATPAFLRCLHELEHHRKRGFAEDTFQTINSPVAAGRQRASGLRIADPRTHPLLQAIILFRQIAHGFRGDDLRRHLAALSGRAPEQISQGAITYQLSRLRLHGFVERLPNSFRYRVTDFGLRAALFFTRAYNRILRPASAAALPAVAVVATPLKRAFDNVDAHLTKWINHAHEVSSWAGET